MPHFQGPNNLVGTSHDKSHSPTQSIHELTDHPQPASPLSFHTAQSNPPRPFSQTPIQHISEPERPVARTRYSQLVEPEDSGPALRTLEADRSASEVPFPSSSLSRQDSQSDRMEGPPNLNFLSDEERQALQDRPPSIEKRQTEDQDFQDRPLTIKQRQKAIWEGTQRQLAIMPEGVRGEEQGQEGEFKSGLWELLSTYACCGRRREEEGGKGRSH